MIVTPILFPQNNRMAPFRTTTETAPDTSNHLWRYNPFYNARRIEFLRMAPSGNKSFARDGPSVQ